MFWLRNKKIVFLLRTPNLRPAYITDEFSEEVKTEETKEVKKSSKATAGKVSKLDKDKEVSKQVDKDKEVSKQKTAKTKETVKSGEKSKVPKVMKLQ